MAKNNSTIVLSSKNGPENMYEKQFFMLNSGENIIMFRWIVSSVKSDGLTWFFFLKYFIFPELFKDGPFFESFLVLTFTQLFLAWKLPSGHFKWYIWWLQWFLGWGKTIKHVYCLYRHVLRLYFVNLPSILNALSEKTYYVPKMVNQSPNLRLHVD